MNTKATVKRDLIKKALLEIERLKAELKAAPNSRPDPVAVIGMACHFPGGITGPEQFWQALVERRDLVGAVPKTRWRNYRYQDHPYLQRAGFLAEDIEAFDHRLFRFSPKEAERTDPQQRLFLKVCWEALENSGYAPNRLQGTLAGVYAGVILPDYIRELGRRYQSDAPEPGDVIGSWSSFLSGRVSYFFGFQGPAITVDTACSASLVAVDLACKGLQAGDCQLAIAGGVNLLYSPETTQLFAALNIVSPDCVLRSFDAKANGTVRGEGCGVVVLKKLSAAVSDGDHIHAVIKGGGVNQDGLGSGLTAPYGPAQEQLLTGVWRRCQLDSRDLGFFEAHGTGTALGDPIEITALGNILAKTRKTPLYLGSVKTNIGHLEAAAGVAGLIKAILAVEKGIIPANLHFETPSPHIDWDNIPVAVPRQTLKWENGADKPRIAAVSAFGLSGTNAHVVVEQYRNGPPADQPENSRRSETGRAWPFKFSSVTENGLRDQLESFAVYLEKSAKERTFNFGDLSYSQNVSKADLQTKLVIWAKSSQDLQATLQETLAGRSGPAVDCGGAAKKTVFLFTGQGSQYPTMFADLYRENPFFRSCMNECNHYYREFTGQDLTPIIFASASRLHETEYTQPALFAVEYSLARLWREYGVDPDLLLGHSIGEYVAACLAGVFGPADALKLLSARGGLMAALPRDGKMAAVFAGKEIVRRAIGERRYVAIAASNTPQQTVISGAAREVDAVCTALQNTGISSVPLQVSHAFHSALMEPMLARFEAVAREVKYASPRKTVISNVTGQPIGAELASWEYWSRHIMAEVRFYESIQSIGNPDQYVFLEIGPAPVLTGMVGDIYGPRADCVASTLPGRKTADQIERSLFQLYNRGVAVAWKKYYRGAGFTKITVPNYRFRERHFGLEELNEPTGSLASSGWIVANQTAPGAVDHPSGMTVAHPDEVKKYLRAALVRELKLDQSELADEENLLLSGINSIITAKLAALCQKDFGITLDKGILLSNCTVNQWTELIYAKIKAADQAVEANIRFCPAPDRRYEPFLLNEVQSAYWAGRNSELEWGGVGCYEAVEIDWDGLDPVRFERALNALTQRHEMLRDIIDADGTQRILPELQPPLTVYRRESIRDLRAHLESVRAAMAAQVLPLGKPMFDIRLTELDAEKWRIHFGIDFMITDALSLDIFWQDLFRLYSGETLPALELSYKDYLTYMSERKKSNRYGVDWQYWTGRAAGFPAAPDLPVNLTGKKLVQGRFARRKKLIDSETWQGFVRAAAGRNLTPSAALLALYAEVLSAWGGGAHFAVMLTAFAREPVHPQINRIIGDFTQLVLVAIHRENRPVAANAAAIQTQMQADLGHSNYSAVEFVKEINKKEAAAGRIYPVVFTSTLGMEALRPDTARSETFWDQLGWAVSSTPQVWLDHQVYQEKEGVSLVWDCWDALFQPDVVDAMFAAYTELVIRAAQAANFWSETLTDLRPASQRHSQAAANHTAREIPDTLLHEPLRYRAVTAPDTTAIVCANRQYSFRQLLARSDQVSELLQEQGVRPGDRVALQMSKSFEQIAVVLGILQVGAAYLPMAFDQPAGRAEEILRQAKVTVLCVDSQLELNDAAVKQLTPADWDGRQGVRREVEIRPFDLAYVIYTSGSTGIPKGVCISHRAAMNTVLEVNRRFAVAATDRILGLSALGFDLSVYDIFGLLSVGGTLVLPTETERLDPKCWHRLSLDQRVSIWNSVPALMDLYVDFLLNGANRDQDPGIRQVILSGDWIPLGLFAKLKQALPHARLTSMGGATEASIWSNYYEVTEIRPEWPSIPYGYPLANQSFHILDQFGRPCPDWVPGKLHIAGRGLADGYLNETELTNQAFFNHSIINERLYDTGDYGCYMGDGAILFHGRKDLQLKINGYRIESGEIEAALKKCGVGGDCVILPVGARMASKKLIAYIQGDPESFSEAELKARLHTYLPDYFIPERIIAAAALPLTANGKFDRKMLLEDFYSRTKTARPTTDGQIAANHPVLRAVREVLNLPELKPDDNLSDLGVSSVDLIKLANRLETVFSDRPAIGEMVKYQSLSELIAYYHHKNSGLAAKDGDQPLEEAAPLAGSAAYRGEAEKSGEALAAATSADWEAAANLVKRCHDRKIRLRLESGRLRFEAPRGAMTAALRAKLQTQKEQLIRYLHSNAVNAENGRPVTSGKTFPLSPMQMAYVLGRSPDYELGDTGAHYYVEFESNDLDPVKLEQAVNEVIRQHEMLRTVIYANGTQQVLEEIPHLKIPVDQISDGRQLEAIRDEWASHRYELGRWPMFHLRISRWDNRRSRLHFSYDCLIVDGWSAELMLREIFGAYYGRPVLKPEYTFREYLSNAARWLQEKNYHWEAANYWKERVKSLPPAPELPWLRKFAAIGRPHFRRLQLMLAAEDYRRLGARLKQYHFTPAAALCTAYLKALSCFSGNRAVTLNLTLFNRLPLHQDVPRLLGDFTNIALIAYQPRSGSTLAQELEAVQSQLWKAIEYRTYNGFNLLRELAREAPGRAVMPVVFTSLLSGDATTADLPADLKEVYATSQTPQVVLDHQVYGRNGALVLVWDFVVEAFAESVITAMFAAYCDLIGQMVAVADWAQVFTVAKDDQSSGSLG